MEQYIPKSAIVAEIERRRQELRPTNTHQMKVDEKMDRDVLMWLNALAWVKKLLNTLEMKEVDLEHEVESYWKQCDMTWCRDAYSMTHIRSMLSDIAKHFFELGISVNNSTKVTTPDVDDVLKENGVNPDSKEAKIIKESYFMAIEKLAQKGE